MNKVKLPRKRKKAYIKARGKLCYISAKIIAKMLIGMGKGKGRFYSFRYCKTDKEWNSNLSGLIITKRW